MFCRGFSHRRGRSCPLAMQPQGDLANRARTDPALSRSGRRMIRPSVSRRVPRARWSLKLVEADMQPSTQRTRTESMPLSTMNRISSRFWIRRDKVRPSSSQRALSSCRLSGADSFRSDPEDYTSLRSQWIRFACPLHSPPPGLSCDKITDALSHAGASQ